MVEFLVNHYFWLSIVPGIITACIVTKHFKSVYGYVTVGELVMFLILGTAIGFAFAMAIIIIYIFNTRVLQIRLFKTKR